VNDKFLKDAILSTIAEIEGDIDNNISSSDDNNKSFESKREIRPIINNDKNFTTQNFNSNSVAPLNLVINEVENDSEIEIKSITIDTTNVSLNNQKTASSYNYKNNSIVAEEEEFLSSILQKINVLFEGLKSDKLKKREEKTDLVIKYLQVLQLSIEDRLK